MIHKWWRLLKATSPDTQNAPPAKPSGFYRARLWRVGLALVRWLPTGLVKGFFLLVAELYYWVRKERRNIVVENLLPVCGGDLPSAQKIAHRLFRKFACKLAELWRLESGVPVTNWITRPEEWEIIRSLHASGRGILFITLHLGNWEHGGLLLAQQGIKLLVLTIAEPGQDLTQLRIASRARWGIETLVIGEDSFAFVEVIKRLQEGAAVAISIDRPPKRGGVPFEFFGRDFRGSNAAADLAWASGCALVGVTVIPTSQGHRVKVLPEFKYERKNLRDREARRQLTQQILRAFEPEIRQHLDEWYHFVPIWPKTGAS